MMQRVLVLEKNRETAERLVAALKRNGAVTVSLVPTMREACLIVAQQPQNLAFIPLEDADQLLHSLRAMQPDLKMILTTADSQEQLRGEACIVFQGLLHASIIERELPVLLAKHKSPELSRPIEAASPLTFSRLKKACQQIGVAHNASLVQMAVLSSENQLIGFCGHGGDAHAFAVVELISQNWEKGQFTAQLQYLQLPGHYDARLIYSRPVAGAVLSLIAEPEVPIIEVRRLADLIASHLADPGEEHSPPLTNRVTIISRVNGAAPEEKPHATYAIAWRAVKPLPKILQNVAQECMFLLAAENGCKLRHISVSPTIMHLVINCPVGRTAAWAAYLLKTGIDQEIQSRFGTNATIWRKGFYATESEQPLSEAELKMLLTL